MSGAPSRKLVWLASFPKSGNTWLRLFLSNYILNCKEPFPINKIHMLTFSDMMAAPYEKLTGKAVKDLKDHEIHGLRPRVHRAIASQAADVMLVKTHQAVMDLHNISTVTFDVTKASIYVMRNPLDVAVSYAHHCGLQPIESLRLLNSSRHKTHGDKTTTVPQYMGRWSDHVLSWVDSKDLAPLVLRYEDMKRNPQAEFTKVLVHLGLEPDDERLERAIRFSSFGELTAQESKGNFIERSQKAEKFFRSGRVGEGIECFSEAEVDQAIADHREVLERFGYLNKEGDLIL